MARTLNLRNISALLLWLVALPALATDAAPVVLTPHQATYKVKIKVLGGSLKTEVRQQGEVYSAESLLRASGFARMFVRGDVREQAEFRVDQGALRPLTYQSEDRISKKDKFLDFTYDWDEGVVESTFNGEPFETPLDELLHDRVTLQYALMLDLLKGHAVEEYSLLEDELKILQVSNIGERDVKVPYGRFTAIGIQHRKKKSKSNRVTTLWCAEELDYLPVIIEQHRDGKLAMRAVLTKYVELEAEPPATAAIHE